MHSIWWWFHGQDQELDEDFVRWWQPFLLSSRRPDGKSEASRCSKCGHQKGCCCKTSHSSRSHGQARCSCQSDADVDGKAGSPRRAVQGIYCRRCIRASHRFCKSITCGFRRSGWRRKSGCGARSCSESNAACWSSSPSQRCEDWKCSCWAFGTSGKGPFSRRALRRRWFQSGSCPDGAKYCPDNLGGTSCISEPRQSERAQCDRCDLKCGWHPRSFEAGEASGRTRISLWKLLFADDAADAQAASSSETCSFDLGRTSRPIHAHLPGETRGLSESEGVRPCHVALGSHCGCNQCRRCCGSERAGGLSRCCRGAICGGSRRLVPGFSSGSSCRTPCPDVPRSAGVSLSTRKTFCTSMPCSVGGHDLGVFERHGNSADQENGDSAQSKVFAGSSSWFEPFCREPFSQEASEVSQEGERSGDFLTDPADEDADRYSGPNAGAKTCRCPRTGRIYFEADGVVGSDGNNSKSAPPLPKRCSLWRWASGLLTQVLRTRTSFAAFLLTTLKLPRREMPASAIFPIPVPFQGIFDRMPRAATSSARKSRLLKQVVHILAMTLNYWWNGCKFISTDLLGRSPSSVHRSMFSRWKRLLLADGPCGVFDIASSGRRFPQLDARVNELADVLTMLGAGGGPYARTFPGHEVPMNDAVLDGLEPYRSLNVERLKVSGNGKFDATDFLDDDLVMAYRYPDILQYDLKGQDLGQFLLRRDSPAETVKLAKLWDAHGLLHLHQLDLESAAPHELTRVFNCLKDATTDRQIGDRRGRNHTEGRLQSASKTLPNGCDFLELWVPKGMKLCISVTDRKDFYHQFWTSTSRAESNSVGPSLPLELLSDLEAVKSLALGTKVASKFRRLAEGDGLGFSCRQAFGLLTGRAMVSFRSILQGDHLGVEIATQSHSNLLASYGLLDSSCRMVSDRPLPSLDNVHGLCIDDFFAISLEDRSTPSRDSRSFEALQLALKAYHDFDLAGSPHKDVFAADSAKVVGAFLNTSERASKLGVSTVGGPPEKRFGLSMVSLHVAQLSHTSTSLHLAILGGWTSLLVYRRVLMGILQDSFKLVLGSEVDPNKPVLVPLNRKVAEELTMVAVLAPLASSELNAEYMDKIFCSDASMVKGAYCSAAVGQDVATTLWRSCRTKGAYTRLQSPSDVMLERLGVREQISDMMPEQEIFHPERPWALRFDFIEVFAGSGRVSKAMQDRGYDVCLPIDLSRSSELNVAWTHVASWLCFMVSERRTKSFMAEPPCTTFSVMRRPALRDALHPFGFDPSDPQTSDGNTLAHRGLQLMYTGLRYEVTGILETPYSSKLKKLPSWKALSQHEGAQACRTDSCAYGSIHLKSFSFLGVHADLEPLSGRCDGQHTHVQVQGRYTLGSAVYTPALAAALAEVMVRGIQRLKASGWEEDKIKVTGLESQLVNEVAVACKWTVEKVWTHKKIDHINIHELQSLYRLALDLASLQRPLRPSCLVDSNVIRGAASKGRSSSYKLMAWLRRYGAVCLAAGLYFTTPFVPTRHNASDDPTRDAEIRTCCRGMDLDEWAQHDLYRLSQLPRLRRWASNWVRLMLLLVGPSLLDFADRSLFRSPSQLPRHMDFTSCSPPLSYRRQTVPTMDFDATLGFPGEGPSSSTFSLSSWPLLRTWIFLAVLGNPLIGLVPTEAMDAPSFMPRNSGDVARAASRKLRPDLPQGRPVLQLTSENRGKLLQQFFLWLRSLGIEPDEILTEPQEHLQHINDLLNRFGRGLYFAGRPYGHYCETINALSAYRPTLRRSLQGAWDLAFAWVREEKPDHHLAMPWQLLLAMLSVALVWGWNNFAGGLALAFGALLRPGEFLLAKRQDLLLPEDVGYTQKFGLLTIAEPKTRFTVARHQSAKLDVPDLLEVVSLAFGHLRKDEPLWNMSGQTFRLRFRQILKSLDVNAVLPGMTKACDPGSLRAGGATWLLQCCEDAEFVRRRGRWVNSKTMEIYLQEVASAQYLMHLTVQQRRRILDLAECFPAVLQHSQMSVRLGLPKKLRWGWPK